MKLNLIPVATAALFSGSAVFAGGYVAPIVAPAVLPVEVIEPLTWQGGYAGVTLGYAFSGDDEVGIGQGNERTYTTPNELELSGANYGLRLGYRWQRAGGSRDWVFGGELGYEGGDISDDFTTDGYSAENEVNSVLALRLKAGPLNNVKNTWFYGILGIGRIDYDYTVYGTEGVAGAVDINEGQTSTGYIVGLGVERKFNTNWSLSGEWEYHNYGKDHLEDVNGKSTEATPDWHTIKIGLNYQF
ncbi:outer membrane protein [Paracoccus aerodenitrificans]|uniref:outer membrane protein n=1 Tax=Paracoccus aerodenitrificans TaxID=3017781 RepID=UPI0022F048D2|nr:outer membrane beta-barrel protein [Paracoccus aerodenitrificans]WBU64111.1 outer membrane beta-barrel protein [Paracoccus aerodenitrificans]